VSDGSLIPPHSGEGDRAKRGGGVFATTRPVIKQARKERRSGNLPEVVMWRALQLRPGGFRFRRQHPFGPYILDFACLRPRVAIEIDGIVHEMGDRPERDARRDVWLGQQGFRVLRFPARDVLSDLDAAINAVVAACSDTEPHHHPSGGPPPHDGEVVQACP
jgi:very-short-patch-repair endonuclease